MRPQPCHSPQRSRGEIEVALAVIDGVTRVSRMYQAGCAKVRFPRQHGGMDPTGVLINSAGGLTGGDRFDVSATLAPGTTATLTTQAAEKIYRSAGGSAEVENMIALGAGARLDWLPQETILFDRADLRRRTQVSMAEDAAFTAVEMLVFGRTAMDEQVNQGALIDHWRIRRGGRLVFADSSRLVGPVSDLLARRPIAAEGVAVALVVQVAADAEQRLDMVRALLDQVPAVQAGASAHDDMLIARLVAPGGAAMRSSVLRLLDGLRDGLPPPRTWMV